MKKEKMVTRLFKLYTVTVMAVDTESAEVSNETVILTALSGKEEKDLKMIQELIGEDKKAVKIVDVGIKEEVRGMTLSSFLSGSVVINRPPSQSANKED